MIEKYIRKSLDNFPDEFVDCVVRAFRQIQKLQGYGEALPVSVMLYIAARKYNLSAEIRMGLLKVQGQEVFAAWCKVGDIIIDPAVYGLTNYCDELTEQYHYFFPYQKMHFSPMATPFIGTKNAAALQNLEYCEDKFDQNWDWADIKSQYGMLIANYIADAPQDCIMKRLAEVLNEEYDPIFAEKIYKLVQIDRIGVNYPDPKGIGAC